MYSIVTSADLRARQLDRAGCTARESEGIAERIRNAIAEADCLLLTYNQLCCPGFPTSHFNCAIEYAPQAVLDTASAQAAAGILAAQKKLLWTSIRICEVNRPREKSQQPKFKAASGYGDSGALQLLIPESVHVTQVHTDCSGAGDYLAQLGPAEQRTDGNQANDLNLISSDIPGEDTFGLLKTTRLVEDFLHSIFIETQPTL